MSNNDNGKASPPETSSKESLPSLLKDAMREVGFGIPSSASEGPAKSEDTPELLSTLPLRDLEGGNENRPSRAPKLPVIDPKHYEILGEMARGGLGRIIKAYDRRLLRTVALKELLQEKGQSRERFLLEALVTARLQHPSIVPIHEAGRWPSGELFYAMKLVNGRSLKDVIEEKKGLTERLSLLPNLLDACEAVAYAHRQKIIHRDLKPQNILVGDFGETVIIDWGLAKDLSQQALTSVGAVLGTPTYMPPEQARGEEVDERADVYSLGAILYHVSVGSPPYTGRSSSEILDKVKTASPTPVELRQPEVPKELATIIKKAMAREVAARYESAKDLAEALRNYQSGQRAQPPKKSSIGLRVALAFVAGVLLTGGLGYFLVVN